MMVIIGKWIRSIETKWTGLVQAVEVINGELMLRCIHTTLPFRADMAEMDDVRWFSPRDVTVMQPKKGQ